MDLRTSCYSRCLLTKIILKRLFSIRDPDEADEMQVESGNQLLNNNRQSTNPFLPPTYGNEREVITQQPLPEKRVRVEDHTNTLQRFSIRTITEENAKKSQAPVEIDRNVEEARDFVPDTKNIFRCPTQCRSIRRRINKSWYTPRHNTAKPYISRAPIIWNPAFSYVDESTMLVRATTSTTMTTPCATCPSRTHTIISGPSACATKMVAYQHLG